MSFAPGLLSAPRPSPRRPEPLGELAGALEQDVRGALDDDLAAPRAIAALFDFTRAANRALDRAEGGAGAALEVFDRWMSVFDVLPAVRAAAPELAQWVEDRVADREKARRAKDFREADRIRTELRVRGVELEDTPVGTKWRFA